MKVAPVRFTSAKIMGVAACLIMALTAPVAAAKGGGKGGGGGGGNGGGGGGGGGNTPTAVVSLGDSYISGEGGRWQGNWEGSSGNRSGTDRAAFRSKGRWYYDASRVYGATDASGCHRSDVAPVEWVTGSDVTVNLACSGAQTGNVISSANGGFGQNGEAAQSDQLAALAQTTDIEVVVLSIGGNDLGFADVIIDCTVEYNTSPAWWPNTCNGEQQANVNAAMPAAMAGVRSAIADIRTALAAAGDNDYRIVLLSYSSPIPRAGEFRYTQSGWDRTLVGGCPFWDVDATWARDSLVPQIADNLAAVASSESVEFLDLRDTFDGREVCSTNASQGSGPDAEWARFLSTGLTQGEAQESMHPSALGQQAIGTCIDAHIAAGAGQRSCHNVPGSGPATMELRPLG